MLYFSFSLYGSDPMYTKGMIKNVEILSKRFPESRTQIYVAEDVPIDIIHALLNFSTVKLVHVKKKPDTQNMFDRFLTIDEPDCSTMIVRDADSRVHDRDIACIEDFIASNKILHIIRDHPNHGTLIMGGLFGIKKSVFGEPMAHKVQRWIKNRTDFIKGTDQTFLKEVIYPPLYKNAMIHDRNSHYKYEILTPFRVPITDKLFCGQVHVFDPDGNELSTYDVNF